MEAVVPYVLIFLFVGCGVFGSLTYYGSPKRKIQIGSLGFLTCFILFWGVIGWLFLKSP